MTQKELEMRVLAHICTYEDDMALLISEGIDENYFIYSEGGREPAFKNLFISAKNYYQKFDRLLSQDAIENKLKQKDEDISSNKALSYFMQCMLLKLDHNSFPMLLKDLKSKKMYTVIQDVMYTIEESLKTDSPAATFDKLKDKILQTEANLIQNTKVGNRIYVLNESYNDIIDSYMDKKENPEKYKGLQVGLSVLDNATNGFKPSTINIVVGHSGAGKSVILTNWAAEIYHRKKNVLFISLEMPLDQVKTRFVSRELCLDYHRLYNGKLTDDEEQILKYKLPKIFDGSNKDNLISNSDGFFIIVTNFDNPDVDYIEEMIRRHQKIYGKIDAVFVDYLNNMKSKEVIKSGGQNWLHSGVCASGLRTLAANYGLTVFTAQQLNRSGLEKGRKVMDTSPADFQANQEDMSGSQIAFHDADSVIGFNPDKENFKMHFKKAKARDFDFAPFSVNYYPSMNRIVDANMDDTTFMLSPLEAQLNAAYQLTPNYDSDIDDEFGDGF